MAALGFLSTICSLKWVSLQRAVGLFSTIKGDLANQRGRGDGLEHINLHGDKDPIPLSVIERTQKSIPNSKLIVLKDCGHFPYVEKPDELFPILDAFLVN